MKVGARDELERLTRQWISLWCVPVDWSLFDALHADDFVDCTAAGRAATKQGFATGIAELVCAFPDLHTRVESLVIDELAGRVAVRWSAVGTHAEVFLGVAATQRAVQLRGIEIIEVVRSRIVRRWGEWDVSDLRGQARL